MNTTEFTQLQNSLKASIKEYVLGNRTYSDAEKDYHEFKKVIELYQENTNFNSSEYLTTLCAAHSCENFAKYTGIIALENDALNIIASYGNKTIKNNLAKIIEEFNLNLKNNIRQTKSISLTKSILYNFHYYKTIIDGKTYLLLSATSSQFFSPKTFKHFTEVVCKLIAEPAQIESPLTFNYFADVKKKILNFLDNNSFDDDKCLVKLYCFDDIPEIFSHMGIDAIADIYDRITIKLKRIYSINSLVLQISGKTFAVITYNPKPEKDNTFSFFSIVINYMVKDMVLTKKTDINKIWDMVD